MSIPVEQMKFVNLIPPQLKDNGAPASLTYVDTKGYSHLRCLLFFGVTDIATTAAPSVSESTATGGTYTAISSAVLAAAPSATADGLLYAIDVDLTAGVRERYIKLDVTAGDGTTGTNLCAVAILSRPDSGDHNGLATDAGLTELVSA